MMVSKWMDLIFGNVYIKKNLFDDSCVTIHMNRIFFLYLFRCQYIYQMMGILNSANRANKNRYFFPSIVVPIRLYDVLCAVTTQY